MHTRVESLCKHGPDIAKKIVRLEKMTGKVVPSEALCNELEKRIREDIAYWELRCRTTPLAGG